MLILQVLNFHVSYLMAIHLNLQTDPNPDEEQMFQEAQRESKRVSRGRRSIPNYCGQGQL